MLANLLTSKLAWRVTAQGTLVIERCLETFQTLGLHEMAHGLLVRPDVFHALELAMESDSLVEALTALRAYHTLVGPASQDGYLKLVAGANASSTVESLVNKYKLSAGDKALAKDVLARLAEPPKVMKHLMNRSSLPRSLPHEREPKWSKVRLFAFSLETWWLCSEASGRGADNVTAVPPRDVRGTRTGGREDARGSHERKGELLNGIVMCVYGLVWCCACRRLSRVAGRRRHILFLWSLIFLTGVLECLVVAVRGSCHRLHNL